MLFAFVAQITLKGCHTKINQKRRLENRGRPMSPTTIVKYYFFFREIAQVVTSHDDVCLGGPGKTIQVAETFLKRLSQKHSPSQPILILGIMCKEDQKCRVFKVPHRRDSQHSEDLLTVIMLQVESQTKRELWPYIKKYVHHDTGAICTDGSAHYSGVERLFAANTEHIFDTEDNQSDLKKILNKSNLRGTTPNILDEYIALNAYRREHLEKAHKGDLGSQIMVFLNHVKVIEDTNPTCIY